jgi:NAD(P)-dependent dehydrogenase (short-subunit alcohol dehydrogenase family)
MTANLRVALVTAADKEIVRGLAQLGFTVLVAARARQRAMVAELASDGLDVRFQQLDVTDEPSIYAAVDRIDEEFGRLDVLVNNACVADEPSVAPSLTLVDDMRRVFETTVFGVVAMTNAMLPLLRRAEAARIVNVVSRLGTCLAYGSAEPALSAITVDYARELAGTPIKVNACATDPDDDTAAKIAIELAVLAADGPSGGFFENGSVTW